MALHTRCEAWVTLRGERDRSVGVCERVVLDAFLTDLRVARPRRGAGARDVCLGRPRGARPDIAGLLDDRERGFCLPPTTITMTVQVTRLLPLLWKVSRTTTRPDIRRGVYATTSPCAAVAAAFPNP